MNSISGRRRAALRVKQKRRKDERTWSPSGKLIKGRQRPQSSQRPCSQLSHLKPWNDRFIYFLEEETECSGIQRKKQSADGKENNNIGRNPSTVGAKQKSRPEIKHYTERCDGEAVLEFTRCEISPTSPIVAKNDECHDLIGTRSVSTSPFDMDKVRAALQADANDTQNEHDDELHLTNDTHNKHLHESENTASLHSRNNDREKRSNGPLANPLLLPPLDRDRVKSLLDNFEDLLYTIELEEELLKRDIASRKHIAQSNSVYPDLEETEGTSHSQIDQNDICQTRTEPRISIPPERCNEIIEYVNRAKQNKDKQHKLIEKNGDMKYHEIAEALAESILDSCIADIARELQECIEHISEDVFQQL